MDSWDYYLAYFDSDLGVRDYFLELIGQQLDISTDFSDYGSLNVPPIFVVNVNRQVSRQSPLDGKGQFL